VIILSGLYGFEGDIPTEKDIKHATQIRPQQTFEGKGSTFFSKGTLGGLMGDARSSANVGGIFGADSGQVLRQQSALWDKPWVLLRNMGPVGTAGKNLINRVRARFQR
jgi:hypothetical protein